MKLVYNNIIPFKGYLAMCVFPFIFVRKDARALRTTDINHETIHGKQQIEMLCVLFFVRYGIEWFIRWVAYGFDGHLAYKNISFEQEAYLHEDDLIYLNNRKLFASWQYLFKTSFIRKGIGNIIVKK